MKLMKITVITLLLLFLPYLVLTLFLKENENNLFFEYGKNTYVKVKREEKNIIEEVPLEEYVAGVLSGEMPINFEEEALKAQAVAARTYVLKKMEAKNDFDVVDTVSNQVYINEEERKEKWKDKFEERNNKIKKVVNDTKGEYVAYDDKVIEAFFFSTSVGVTENSGEVFSKQLPYLVSVESKWDEKVSPVYQVEYDFELKEFYQKLGLPYQEQLNIEILNSTSSGRVKKLSINGVIMDAGSVFSKLNLKSTFFTIVQNSASVHITTKGYGHGVGMSQYGANGMAKEGYQYDQILKHYYQGTVIKNLKK